LEAANLYTAGLAGQPIIIQVTFLEQLWLAS